MKAPTLTQEQAEWIRSLEIPEQDRRPVRFMYQGYPIKDLLTGEVGVKGTSIMHQHAFWGFDKKTAHQIATWMGVTPIFSN